MTPLLHLIICVFFGPPVSAYIPKYNTIFSKTAERHGKGSYQIDREILLSRGGETATFHESWIVSDGESMRVSSGGRGDLPLRLTLVYAGDKRYYVDENGTRKMSPKGSDWHEIYFHFRTPAGIRPKIISDRILGSESLSTQKTSTPNAPFFRLSRFDGVVTYALGTPSPLQGEAFNPLPGLWIEQDLFLVRKIRLPSSATVSAYDYTQYSNALHYPRRIEILWDNSRAEITTSSVKPLAAGKFVKELLTPTHLNFAKNPDLAAKLPPSELVKEFYQRFR